MRKMKKKTFTAAVTPEISERETAHQKQAGRAAEEGIVLLKNDNGLLPLAVGSKIALYGRGVRRTVKGGTGSGSVNERRSISLYEGIKAAGFEITTEEWLDDYDAAYDAANRNWQKEIADKSKQLWSFDAYSHTPFAAPVGSIPTKTAADIAICVISRIAGENADRKPLPGDYYLSAGEEQQIAALCELYNSVILVINAGGQVDLSIVERYPAIHAVLILGMPGMSGGTAFANILLGNATPSGKLADTWALRYEDFPNAATFSHCNGNTYMEYYHEGIYVGYRYFDTFDVPVQYSFGFGLSYTTFGITFRKAFLSGTEVTVCAQVKNTGNLYSGKEVVQLYATCPAEKMEKEFRRLVGFAKTECLAPGEEQTVEIHFPLEYLDSYDECRPGWILEQGSYYLWLGNSLDRAAICTELKLTGDVLVEATHNECFRLASMKELSADRALSRKKREDCAALCRRANVPVLEIPDDIVKPRTVLYRTNRELSDPSTAGFLDILSDDQLLRLANGELRKDGTRITIAGDPKTPGACGETSRCAQSLGLPSLLMADGPAGLRLTPTYQERNGELLPSNSHLMFSEGKMITTPDTSELAEGARRHYQYCTAIPVGTQIGQSWNVALAQQLGELVAREMVEFGITIWLAPGMNIHRNPLCGRNFEYFSEDPVLTGKMAGAITAGVQGNSGCMTIDTLSKKRILVAAILITMLAFVLYSAAESPAMIFTARLVHGIGMGFTTSTCLALATEVLPKEKLTQGIGYYSLAQTIATAIGPSIGLWVVNNWGYSTAFRIGACIMALSGILAARMRVPEAKAVSRRKKVTFDTMFEKRAFVPALLLFCTAISSGSISAFLVIYAQEVRSVDQIGLYFTVNAVCLLITRPVVGSLGDKFGIEKVLLPAFVLFGIAMLLISYAETLPLFLLAAIINAFGFGAAHPIIQALCMKSVPSERRGVASTTSYIGTDLGYLIGSPVAGALVNAFGYDGMFRMMVIPIAAAILVLVFSRQINSRVG